VLAVDRVAHAHGPDAVASVGCLDVTPNSRNVVPGEVFLTSLEAVRLGHPLQARFEGLSHAGEDAVIGVAQVHGQDGFSHRRIVSGAGHDAAYIARVAPTTMVFVPCLGGISHNVTESTTREECAAGAQSQGVGSTGFGDARNRVQPPERGSGRLRREEARDRTDIDAHAQPHSSCCRSYNGPSRNP
jgi:hypothetical protein